MKITRTAVRLCAAALLSAVLGGCVVVPVPYHHWHEHYGDRR